MKRLQYFSVDKLNKISKHKEIYCYGCGKIFFELIERYADEPFVQNITKVIDGNKNIWGTSVKVQNKEIRIESPDVVEAIQSNDVLILITTNRYEEVYESLCKKIARDDVICSKYPETYYESAKVWLRLFSWFPKKRSLLFHYGNESHENAIAILKYLKEENLTTKHRVVLLTEKGSPYPRYVKENISILREDLREKSSVKNMIRYCYYYASSKYLCYENEYIPKVGKGQKLIYLNHGTLPLKNVKDVLRQPEELDYAVCPSSNCAQIYLEQYGVPVEKQIYMMQPRVSLLFNSDREIGDVIRQDYKQLIMWLPTFRSLKGSERVDSKQTNVCSLLSKEEAVERLNETLRKHDQVLVIKRHPREKAELQISSKYQNICVIDNTDLEQADIVLQEILGKTDALLTDYSGIMFEYLFLNKPIGYVIDDMEEYHRGFSVENPLDYMQGEKITTIDALCEFLEKVSLGRDEYKERRSALRKKIFEDVDFVAGTRELMNLLEMEKI